MPNNLPIETLQPIVLIESIDDLEVSFSSTNIEAETDDNIIGLSEAIGWASNEVSQIADFLNSEKNSDEEIDINKYQAQMDLINQNIFTSNSICKFLIFNGFFKLFNNIINNYMF